MLEEDIGKIIETTLADEANGRMKVILPIYVCFLYMVYMFFCFTLTYGCILFLMLMIQMQALQNMYEYLLDAEKQLGSEKASDNTVNSVEQGGHNVPVAAGAGDTNICGGIVQLFWDKILGRCLDFDDQIRQTSLKVRLFFFINNFCFCIFSLV